MGKSDDQLVAEARAGSQGAFTALVDRYERPVFNLLARMVRDRTLAEDLSQDAFVKAFRRLETYRADQGKFSNWVFKIAHNTTIDHLRRSRVTTVPIDAGGEGDVDFHSILPDESSTTPLEGAVRMDLAKALGVAIEQLRPEYREVVVLRHQEGLSYEEIADLTEMPLGTVKTYLHRARKELAGLLAASGWGPEPAG